MKTIIIVLLLISCRSFAQKYEYIEVTTFYNFNGSRIRFYINSSDHSLDSLWAVSQTWNEKKKKNEIVFVDYTKAVDFWNKLGEQGFELVTTAQRDAPDLLNILVNTIPATVYIFKKRE
jgi:hypothetical protein